MPDLLNFGFYAVVIAGFAIVLLGLGSRRSQRRPRFSETAASSGVTPLDEEDSHVLGTEVESADDLGATSSQ